MNLDICQFSTNFKGEIMNRIKNKSYFIPSSNDVTFGVVHKEGRKSLVQDVYLNSKTYIIKEYRFYKRNFNKRFIRASKIYYSVIILRSNTYI